ncbi:MAG: SDR family oxidoreductase [Flavobacterium sp.]|nr:SDR family oxidoreductase [Flavobacterium sp.]
MKTYVFAGASSLIAQETAKLLQAKGHKVIGVSTKPKSYNYDEFYQIESYVFGNFPTIEEDLHGLVYFPGNINLKPFHRLKPEEFTTDFTLNSLGAVAFTQSYLNNLKSAESASVVFISTVAVGVGLPFHSSISMAKGAIEGLTKALAAEYAPSIRVNCVAPSLVNTPLGEKFLSTPEKVELMQKRNPMNKVGAAMDIANAISFLLNEESNWITGQILAVDGGMSTLKNG